MDAFIIDRGDTLPNLAATLSDDSGTPDLTGATVRFVMKNIAKGLDAVVAPRFKKVAVIVDPTAATVRYEWDAEDTDIVGIYGGKFEVTFAGGRVKSYPTVGVIPISVVEDVG